MDQQYLGVVEEQNLTTVIGGRLYRFRFYPFRNQMYMDLHSGEDYIFAGKRIMTNRWILPDYLAAENGNLRFETYAPDANEYVWWEGFNKKFRLVAYSYKEIKDMENKS